MFLLIAQEEYGLKNAPAIDRREPRPLLRYSGKTSKLSISFDAQLMAEGVIRYDDQAKSLTISELPETLLAELQRDKDLGP